MRPIVYRIHEIMLIKSEGNQDTYELLYRIKL